MRRKVKSIAAVLTASALVFSMAACGSKPAEKSPVQSQTASSEADNKEESAVQTESGEREKTESGIYKTGLPIADEGQTLKVLTVQLDPDVAPEDTVLHQEIEAATGVKIEWECIPQTSWPEKKGLLFASGDLPDVIVGGNFTDNELLTMAEGGQILPLNDLIDEYGENFKKVCEADESVLKDITAPDGNIYGLPYYMSGQGEIGVSPCRSMLYINQKWLDTLGLDMPTTTEEFKEVLIAFRDGDPNGNGIADEVGISAVEVATHGSSAFIPWTGAFGIMPADSVGQYPNIMVKDGKVAFAAVQDEWKEAVKYFNELWQEGLIDKETFTQDNAMFNAKLKNPDTRVVGAFNAWRGTSFRLDDNDDEYVIMPPLTGPDGECLYGKYYYGVQNRGHYVITSACEDPELAMRWADYLITPEISYQAWTGVKIGYSIQMKADGSGFELIEPQPEFGTSEYNHQVRGEYGIKCVATETMNWKPIDPNPFNVDNETGLGRPIYSPYFPEEYYPNTFLSLEEAEIVSELSADINSYVSQMYAKWISEGGIDKEWDSYVSKLNSMGLEDYLAQYQAALDRYNQ